MSMQSLFFAAYSERERALAAIKAAKAAGGGTTPPLQK